MLGNLEDADLAALVNPQIQAVVIHEGFPWASTHELPLLREVLASSLGVDPSTEAAGDHGLELARVIKSIRPEIDLYLLDDCRPEDVVSDPAAAGLRRVFYEAEEPLEIHLAILEGVDERYRTPYFDNLKKYAQKPIGTFHALPIARGKSVFRSDWIRDLGEFYGPTLFLAESSARPAASTACASPPATSSSRRTTRPRVRRRQGVFRHQRTSTSNRWCTRRSASPATSSSSTATATSRTTTAACSPARSRTTSRCSRSRPTR